MNNFQGHLNAVIDLYHGDTVNDWHAVFNSGIRGIIHKATQGPNIVDSTFEVRAQLIRSTGMMLGAYHFGVNSDGVTQADHFLKVVREAAPAGLPPFDRVLLALDWEPNSGASGTMLLPQAQDFISRVHEVTGRWPVLYSGNAFFNSAMHSIFQTPLKNCPLWIARYGDKPPVMPPQWKRWHFWQYTGDGMGPEPHTVPGIAGPVDRECFNGRLDELRTLWGYAPFG